MRTLSIIITLILLTACTSPLKPSPPPTTISAPAPISSIEIQIMESFPVQVSISIEGYLSDGCSEIGKITKDFYNNTFTIAILANRPSEAMCTQQITPFKKTIPLNVLGLKAGTYTVNVNGNLKTFEIEMDNIVPLAPI